jgi:RNA polymerase sigma-32 factor
MSTCARRIVVEGAMFNRAGCVFIEAPDCNARTVAVEIPVISTDWSARVGDAPDATLESMLRARRGWRTHYSRRRRASFALARARGRKPCGAIRRRATATNGTGVAHERNPMSPLFGQPLTQLTAEQELALFAEYKANAAPELEDRLLGSQLRLVIKLAREVAARREDVDDLIQEGALGLIQGIRRFDPSRGARLSTYAAWWIRAYQFRWLLANHRLVRVGTTTAQRRIFFNARSARQRLSAAGADDSATALARRLGVSDDELEETLRRIDHKELSLDQPIYDGDGSTRMERLVDERNRPDERVAAAELERLVRREATRFRDSLSGRERALFDARWTCEEQPTLQEMGARFGVSRERARQLEKRLLGRLRERLPSELADAA